jgi:hypothetical protein
MAANQTIEVRAHAVLGGFANLVASAALGKALLTGFSVLRHGLSGETDQGESGSSRQSGLERHVFSFDLAQTKLAIWFAFI